MCDESIQDEKVINVSANELMDELDRAEREVNRAVEAYARRAVQSPPSHEWIDMFEDIAVKTKKLTDIKDKIRYYLNGGL